MALAVKKVWRMADRATIIRARTDRGTR